MTIKVGTGNISSIQENLLLVFEESADEDEKISILENIFSDEDILMGEENLHPNWVEYFKENENKLVRQIPLRKLRKIRQGFSELYSVDELRKIDPNNVKISFLLGAGASKPPPSDIPTVKELLPDLLSRARRLERPDLQKLADFCDENGIVNIEDLMTAVQISEFCSNRSPIFKLVDYLIYRHESQSQEQIPLRFRKSTVNTDASGVAFLQDTLENLFSLLSSRMLPAKPNACHDAIADYVIKKPDTSIVTTNYDCCMDLALLSKQSIFSYMVDFGNKLQTKDDHITSLIKLHGSLNWYYCETCQQVFIIDIEKAITEYLNDEKPYSVVALCKDCGGQRKGLLVPPLAMKFDMAPPLTPLIEKAQNGFNKAELIIVVGFSFSDADKYISRMLTKSLQRNPKAQVVIFDPDYDVVEKIKNLLSLRITNFHSDRIIRVMEDCSVSLPRFLSGELLNIHANSVGSKKIKKN